MVRVTVTHTVDTPTGFHVSDDEQVTTFLDSAFEDVTTQTRNWLDDAGIEYAVLSDERSSVIGGDVTELELSLDVPEEEAEQVHSVFSTTPVDVSVHHAP